MNILTFSISEVAFLLAYLPSNRVSRYKLECIVDDWW